MSAYTAGSGRKLEAEVRRLLKRVESLTLSVASFSRVVEKVQETFERLEIIEDADAARAKLLDKPSMDTDPDFWEAVCTNCVHQRQRHYVIGGCEEPGCPCGKFT